MWTGVIWLQNGDKWRMFVNVVLRLYEMWGIS
jgi:hypothetical protein